MFLCKKKKSMNFQIILVFSVRHNSKFQQKQNSYEDGK